jgi:mono/diheme cytochrome c family protein
VGPDGALYIADDVRGRIWRVTYRGNHAAGLVEAPGGSGGMADAGPVAGALPAGVTPQLVARGRTLYQGQTCVGCHGSDGRGSMAGGALTGPEWLWSDGSVDGIAATITRGVDKPRKASGAMPAWAARR